MCFSASASFTAATILAALGIGALAKSRPHQKYLAAIPLLFGIQQASEGFLWLILNGTLAASLQPFMMYTFLFFAFLVWPIWIPLSLFYNESVQPRKKLLTIPLIIGALWSIGLTWLIITYGAQAQITCSHIAYTVSLPEHTSPFFSAIYLCTTVLPFFIASDPLLWFFGCLVGGSYILTYMIWQAWLISVWCFFAAVLSAFVCFYVYKSKNR